MKRSLILVVLGILLAIGVLGLIVYRVLIVPDATEFDLIDPERTSTFPQATSSIDVTSGKMTVTGRSGQSLIINDVTDAPKLNEETYLLKDGSSLQNLSFNVVFFAEYDQFQVTLEMEPVGEMRQQANEFLVEELGVTSAELCEVNISVKTTVYVNQFYAGQELGLPQCPGSYEF